jgi:hypothetical protein
VTRNLPEGWSPADQRLLIGEAPFEGEVEDVRLQSVARSRAWVDAHLKAMNDVMLIFEEAPVAAEPEVSGAVMWAGTPIALYEFEEGTGSTIHDTSGLAPSLHLEIADQTAVEWLPGALHIERAAVIESTTTADKIVTACQSSGEISVEAWIQPDHLLLGGPARIVSLSPDVFSASFTLAQELKPWSRGSARYFFRLRTDQTNEMGEIEVAGNDEPAMTPLEAGFSPRRGRTQVVFTRNSDEICAYVDGALSSEGCTPWPGSLDVWELEKLRLGNEWDPGRDRFARPWLGTYYRVAIYCEALTESQVLQNYTAGTSGI